MKALNKEIKVTKLVEILDVRLLEQKRGLKDCVKAMRENQETMNKTDQFLYTENQKKVNPIYEQLIQDKMKIGKEIDTIQEKKLMYEEALKRYSRIEQTRDGQKYLEDAVIEVSLSQMAKWGIGEDDVK